MGRIETLTYDKAADSSDIHLYLAQEGIKPVIEKPESLEKPDPGDAAGT